ncbi:hypothetical protein CGLAMM_00270 [Acetobacteraceae bacterium EV16G]|uniref:Uncharacterized protein n=1 Tax=Sorlinia euscelidii TaxID=3081148 RepID=A0ABU7U2M3_9PROT
MAEVTAISHPTAEGATDRNPKIFERKWIWFGFQNFAHHEDGHGSIYAAGEARFAALKGSFQQGRQMDQEFVILIFTTYEKGVTEVTP